MTSNRLASARRAVVKVGSNVLTVDSGLNLKAVAAVSRQISRLMARGLEVILVSSGAMASGLRKIGLSRRPDLIRERQAVAAVGQAGLIMAYEKAFNRHGKQVAQVLLTSDDLCNRERYLNGRNTLNTLLEWGVVPIINENDTVKTEEIAVGDNDNLAAMITLLMDADILINLTDIDGLFTKDPRRFADAELISEVRTLAKSIEQMASDIPGALGTGGMLSKIKAARKVTSAGIPMIIAAGLKHNILLRLFDGQPHGTYFVPKQDRLASRKSWIAFTLKPQGVLCVDAGAAVALTDNGKSLLPSGITAVEGDFRVGAAVNLKTPDGRILGIGLVNYEAGDIRKIMGLKTRDILPRLGAKPYDEIVHRDNLVITANRL
ncbi:MAG: glutamate 5-kinase [Pseudomonadota bacterium]